MTREDILARITPICSQVFNIPGLTITESLDATQVDTWTSLSFMVLLSRIEEEFGFKFRLIELLKIRDIGTLIDAILLHQ